MIEIHDVDDRRIAIYRSLKGKDCEREGLFIAEGPRVVSALLRTGHPITSCLASMSYCRTLRSPVSDIIARKIPLYVGEDGLLETIIGFRFHQGIIAAAPLFNSLTPGELVRRLSRPRRMLALNGIADPQNVGLIARNAAAFGFYGMIIDKGSCSPYYRKAVRVSVGGVFALSVAYTDDLLATLTRFRSEEGFLIVAASPRREAVALEELDLSSDLCLVFGNEQEGIAPAIANVADALVRIPMTAAVDSLNVGCASAVILSRLFRDGTAKREPTVDSALGY